MKEDHFPATFHDFAMARSWFFEKVRASEPPNEEQQNCFGCKKLLSAPFALLMSYLRTYLFLPRLICLLTLYDNTSKKSVKESLIAKLELPLGEILLESELAFPLKIVIYI